LLLEQTVLQIQSGNETLRNALIAEYQHRVAKTAGNYCRKYIDPSKDDEFTIALSAFNEAIDRYKQNAEQPFLEFADTLIVHRLSEYVNRGGRIMQPIRPLLDDDTYEKPFGLKERQGELKDLGEALEHFGISFADLAEESPEDADTRSMLFGAGRTMAEDADLMRRLLKTRKLPAKELTAKISVPRKVVERHANYIAMLAFLYNGPFPHLRDYWKMDAASARDRREHDV